MGTVKSMSWEEIYDYWCIYSNYGPSILKEPILPVEMYINFGNMKRIFYGYDWLSLKQYDDRKSMISDNLQQFLYFTKPTNKGTIHTLNMLVNSANEEEQAAIWLYTFSKEIVDRETRGNIGKYAYELCRISLSHLEPHFFLWHSAMKKLVPEILINHNIYSETEFHSLYAVVELARLNAAMILQEYVPIL